MTIDPSSLALGVIIGALGLGFLAMVANALTSTLPPTRGGR